MMLDHIFVSVSASDTNPRIGKVENLAAIRTDRNGRQLQAYCSKLGDGWGTDFLRYFKKAMIEPFDSKYIVVTHNAYFVRSIIGTIGENSEETNIFPGRAWLDLAALAWPMAVTGMISSTSLDCLTKHFGLDGEENTTTVGDCCLTMKIYWAMMQRYKTAIAAEEMVRNAGGDTLASVRKWLRF